MILASSTVRAGHRPGRFLGGGKGLGGCPAGTAHIHGVA